ncbi:MAG: hypothetical protein JWQ49_3612, partial [Edaphobacter sp.]|nr:hypothetical protein [Edaphobacter sp.]
KQLVNELEERNFTEFLTHPLLLALACIVNPSSSTQQPENALSGPDTALNSRNLPSCLYSNPGQKAMHAKRIVSSLYLYPGQTLAGTSSGYYVQQSGISVQ